MEEKKKGRPVAPCKGCEERRAGCHSVCEKYITYKKENDEYRKNITSERLNYLYGKSIWTDEQRKRIMKGIKRKRG